MDATQNINNPNELLTVKEVAQRLRVTTSTVHRWVQVGELDAIRIKQPGRKKAFVRVTQTALDNFFRSAE